jgi:adenylate cyclase
MSAAPDLIENRTPWQKLTAFYQEKISTKIIGLYMVLVFAVGALAAYVVIFALGGSIQTTITDQLANKGRAANGAMVKLEDSLLTVQRTMSFTVGVEDDIVAKNLVSLQRRLGPIQVNTRTQYVDVFDAQGVQIAALRPEERAAEVSRLVDPNAKDWSPVRFVVNNSVDEFGDKFTALIHTSWGEDVVYSGGPVKKDGETVGVILVGMSLSTVADRLTQESAATALTLYGAEGQPIATTLRGGLEAVPSIDPALVRQFENNTNTVSLRDNNIGGVPLKEMVNMLSIRGKPAVVLGINEDASQLYAQTFTAQVVMMLVLSGVAGLVIVLGLLLARSLTRPINALVNATERLRDGDLDVEVPVMSRDETGVLAREFNQMVGGLRERDKARDAFGRYFSEDFYSMVQAGQLELGGEKREITVVMSDIRSFTTLSETMDPTELVSFLNEYFTLQVDAIKRHGGEVDKYMGDAILAKFGAPIWYPDHARRAALAMLDMREALEIFNKRREDRGEAPIRIGIGANTGQAIVGNIGSTSRMEYTIIGDTVNATQRIEDLCKELRWDLLISETVYDAARDLVEVGEPHAITLRGRQNETLIYPLVSHKVQTDASNGSDSTNGTHLHSNGAVAASAAAGDLNGANGTNGHHPSEPLAEPSEAPKASPEAPPLTSVSGKA